MPADRFGQLCTFATEMDPDATFTNIIWIRATRNGDTLRQVAARRGHPELANDIADLNGIRSITQKLKRGRLLRIPGQLDNRMTVHVPFGDERPLIKDGYAQYETVGRQGRVGITRFTGYNPLSMEIQVTFEAWLEQDGVTVERAIEALERMCGRGPYKGAAFGPPAVIRVSVTDSNGNVVPLVPASYQWSSHNPAAPLWRMQPIQWQPGALSDDHGRRIRAAATITVWEYTPINLTVRSAADRAKEKMPRARSIVEQAPSTQLTSTA